MTPTSSWWWSCFRSSWLGFWACGGEQREARGVARQVEMVSSDKLTASDESHDKENLLIRLEHVAHSNKEWVIGLQKDVLL